MNNLDKLLSQASLFAKIATYGLVSSKKEAAKILGVKEDATKEEIKKAYRQLVKIKNTDIPQNQNSEAAKLEFQLIVAAYDKLMEDDSPEYIIPEPPVDDDLDNQKIWEDIFSDEKQDVEEAAKDVKADAEAKAEVIFLIFNKIKHQSKEMFNKVFQDLNMHGWTWYEISKYITDVARKDIINGFKFAEKYDLGAEYEYYLSSKLAKLMSSLYSRAA